MKPAVYCLLIYFITVIASLSVAKLKLKHVWRDANVRDFREHAIRLIVTKSEQNMRDGEENRPGLIENSLSLSFREISLMKLRENGRQNSWIKTDNPLN